MNTSEILSKALGILECLMISANQKTADAIALAAELIEKARTEAK